MSTILKDISYSSNLDSRSFISFEDYKRLYYKTEDGFKYEWNNGTIEKTESRKQTEIILVDNLIRLFIRTKAFQQGGMLASIDMWTSEIQYRRPDLAIYFANQAAKMSKGENQIAQWVGEIISLSDTAEQINKKLIEYFIAGVKCVWHIFSKSDQVYIYTTPDEVTICRGKKICNGKPALDDFEISAEEIFAYKKHLKKKA